MRTKRTESKLTSGRGGFRGTWNPEGTAQYLDGKKYVVNEQLRTVMLPLSDKDKEYLKSIHSPELGYIEPELIVQESKSQEDTLLEAEVRAELEDIEDVEEEI